MDFLEMCLAVTHRSGKLGEGRYRWGTSTQYAQFMGKESQCTYPIPGSLDGLVALRAPPRHSQSAFRAGQQSQRWDDRARSLPGPERA